MKDNERTLLINTAIENIKNSYAPYSNFNVSAAVLTESGNIYKGVNIENSSFAATMCAERSAVSTAISSGEKRMVAIAIVGGKNGVIDDYCPPCGICRQFMREFCNPKEMIIILAKSENDYKEYNLEQLLPESFGPEFVK